MHSSVEEAPELAEILLSGRGAPVEDSETYVLFELGVESVLTTVYEDGRSTRRRWKRGDEPRE